MRAALFLFIALSIFACKKAEKPQIIYDIPPAPIACFDTTLLINSDWKEVTGTSASDSPIRFTSREYYEAGQLEGTWSIKEDCNKIFIQYSKGSNGDPPPLVWYNIVKLTKDSLITSQFQRNKYIRIK